MQRSSTSVVLHENWWLLVSQLWQKMEPSQHQLKCRSDLDDTKQNWVTESAVHLLMLFLSPLLQSEMYVFYWMFWTSYCSVSLLSQSGTVPHKSIQLDCGTLLSCSILSYNNTQMHYILMLYCYVVSAFIDKFAMASCQ